MTFLTRSRNFPLSLLLYPRNIKDAQSRVPEEIHSSFVVKYLLIEFCTFVLLLLVWDDDFPRFPPLQVLRFLSIWLALLSNAVDTSSRFLSDCMLRHSSIWALTATESALFSMGLEHTGQHISELWLSRLLALLQSLTPCCSMSLSPCWQFRLSPGWGGHGRSFSFSAVVVRFSVQRCHPRSGH